MVDGLDVVRAGVRWVHAIAAVAWVGGSLFYLVVLRPALANPGVADRALKTAIQKGFRDVVDLSIIALIATGVYITFDRLSTAHLGKAYMVVLGLKLAVVLAMFWMARDLGTRLGRLLGGGRAPSGPPGEPSLRDARPQAGSLRKWLAPSRMILALGLVAFFLSMLLVMLFESDVSRL